MPPSESITPRDRRADEIVSVLSARGDSVAVVKLVEAWLANGSPTARARVHEGRAFLRLRLMDRALVRAREATDAMPDDADALRLLAEIYLERGWPSRARKPLDALKSLGAPDLDDLIARANEDAPRPETNARDIEREGDPHKLLTLAEGFLATGSFLRATGILERLRRQEPDNARVSELLWGLGADFGSEGHAFDALLDGLAPPSIFRPVLPAAGFDEPEHTENLRIAPPLADDDSEEVSRAFPSLFKGATSGTPFDDDAGEVTQASRLVSVEDAATRQDPTDPGASFEDNGGGDTQIRLVLKPGEAGADQGIHRRKDNGVEEKQIVNLRDWRESMGVETENTSASPELEDEDENVHLVGAAPSSAAPEAIPAFTGPIQVIEKHAIPDPSAFADEAPTTISRPYADPTPPPLPPIAPPPAERSGWMWIGAAAVLAILFVLAVLAFAHIRESAVSGAVRTGMIDAMGSGSWTAMREVEAKLGPGADDDPAIAEALAEIKLAIWTDYDGDPARLHDAEARIEAPSHPDAHRAALLTAALALARGDADSAAVALAGQPLQDDEERLLAARIHTARGDAPSALRALTTLEDPGSVHARVVRASLGQGDALEGAPPSPFVDLARVEARIASAAPDARIAAADTLLKAWTADPPPPRLLGRVYAIKAAAWTELGREDDAEVAMEEGLAHDGTQPALVYQRAAIAADEGRLTDALADLDAILALRRADPAALRARALVLLDLDRHDELDQAISRLRDADAALVRELVTNEERKDIPKRTEAETLDRLALQLRGSPDPFLQRLAPRVACLAAQAHGPAAVVEWAKSLADDGAEDAGAHLRLARWHLVRENRARASVHLDRAAKLAPQYALAHYARGVFWLASPTGSSRAFDAFHAYLAVSPTGPRAIAVNQQVAAR